MEALKGRPPPISCSGLIFQSDSSFLVAACGSSSLHLHVAVPVEDSIDGSMRVIFGHKMFFKEKWPACRGTQTRDSELVLSAR